MRPSQATSLLHWEGRGELGAELRASAWFAFLRVSIAERAEDADAGAGVLPMHVCVEASSEPGSSVGARLVRTLGQLLSPVLR